jgi:phage FluMu protein Com
MATYKSSRVQVSCQECGHVFNKSIGPQTFEIKCPRCKSYDVEVY